MKIQKIVFDLDNTLIPWEDRYNNAINKTFEELSFSYTSEDIKAVLGVIRDYDRYYSKHDKDCFRYLLDERMSHHVPLNFVDCWLNNLGKCVPLLPDKALFSTLEDLANYYDLAVFTGWFRECQVKRLENSKLLPFFSEVIGTDEYPVKPYSEGFVRACGEYLPSECLMVGDNLDKDIMGASIIGMNTVLVDINNKNKKYDGDRITHVKELQKILRR